MLAEGKVSKGKAIAYAKASSADQEDLERQRRKLLEFAGSKGYRK